MKGLILALAAGAVAFLELSLASQRSNCGGNSAALWACSQVAGLCRLAADERRSAGDNVPLQLETLLNREGEEPDLREAMHSGFVHEEDYLILNPTTRIAPDTRTMVIVCSHAYDNVPRPTPWNLWNLFRRTTAHAAGYSDGTYDLISPADFSALDQRQFVRLTE